MADSKTLASTVVMKVTGTHTNTRDGLGIIASDPFIINYTDSLADGTSTDQADLIYHERIVESGASETIFDLSALASSPGNFDVGADAFGADIAFVNIKCLMVRSVSGGTLTIGGTTAAEWFDTDVLFGITNSKIFLPALSVLQVWAPTAGWPVTDNTKDKFIINTSTTATYDIVLIGTSA